MQFCQKAVCRWEGPSHDLYVEKVIVSRNIRIKEQVLYAKRAVIGCQVTLYPTKEARVRGKKRCKNALKRPLIDVVGVVKFTRDGEVIEHGDPHLNGEGIALCSDLMKIDKKTKAVPNDAFEDSEFYFGVELCKGASVQIL